MIFLLAGGLILGKKYFLNSILGSVLYPAIMWVFEQVTPLESLYTGIDVASQALLFSILGGILIGISQAILVRNGGNTGGTDIPIQITNKYFHVPLSLSVYLIDGTIVFAGWFTMSNGSFINTLYAILIIYICGLVSDKTLMLVSGNQKSCNIVTKKSEEIKQAIFDRIDRGVTLIDCKGGYKGEEKTVLVCVVANNKLHT